QQVWRAAPGEDPRPLTPPTDGRVRWARFVIDAGRRAVFCLREDQSDPELEPVNSLVRLDLDGENEDLGTVLVAGKERPVAERASAGGQHSAPEMDAAGDASSQDEDADLRAGGAAYQSGPDFILDPVLSPDGRRIAWLQWDHPHMSWHETVLWVGELDDAGDLRSADPVAGGAGESLEQPEWLDDDTLLVLSDRTGFSNLYRLDVTAPERGLVAITEGELDLGQPRWVPGTRSYALLPDGSVVSCRTQLGFRQLIVVDTTTGAVRELPCGVPYRGEPTVIDQERVAHGVLQEDQPHTVWEVELATGNARPVVGAFVPFDRELAVRPEPVSWTSTDGATAHGFLYRPKNPHVTAPEGDLPPLIVTLHGGPTAAATPGFSAERTFWTSRGFAVLDVNYGGSTGFGRAYRERLDGRWGEVDVQDATSGAAYLAEQGIVDGDRLLITGGSAGGFTTLAAATFTDVFAAGASHFGVSDLAALATGTHKLESRYLDGLVAPWPQGAEVYAERSPIH
ncbi:MAG: prolyl oligopeptidase family serine peptidase, partial [Micrococcus sp.]|nr:prolyl oligopeptidase family serine peptidase [Micrococcus sp.]